LAEVSLSFVPYGQAACPAGSLKVKLQKAGRLMGATAYAYYIERTMALFRTGFEDLPQLIHNIKLVSLRAAAALLERATLCITQSGLNTALDSLEFGVPMVSIPIASDQPGIAMRSKCRGAATVIPVAELPAGRLIIEIEKVPTNSNYREAAQAAAKEIAKLNPVPEAVRIIERVLSAGG
jgi:UDP:flavonoid glycosyltransferase YjiC (YdhE family)